MHTATHSFPPPPLFVSWELTPHSNALSFQGAACGPEALRAAELSSLEALAVVDELADADLPLLGLTGGEPLLRSDWRRIAERAIARGVAVSLTTNGLAVTERAADELAEVGVQSVTVSLDSHLAAVHDRLHGCPGLHLAAVDAIRRLVSRGLRTVVSFTPTRLNCGHLAEVVAAAVDLGAAAVTLSEYMPRGHSLQFDAPSPAQVAAVVATWGELHARYAGRIVLLGPDLWATLGAPAAPGAACAASRRLARIRPDGTVTPCPFITAALGSLRDEPFTAIWARAVRAPSPERGTLAVIPVCTACRSLAAPQATVSTAAAAAVGAAA